MRLAAAAMALFRWFRGSRGAVLAIVVVVALCSAVGAVALNSTKTPTVPAPTAAADRTLSAIKTAFSLFRADSRTTVIRAHSAAAQLPPTARLAYAGPSLDVYAYLNGDDFCVEQILGGTMPHAATGCAHSADAVKAGASVIATHSAGPPGATNGSAPVTIVAAILPDSVKSVTVDRPDGTSSTVPVSNNAFVYTSSLRDWKFTAGGVSYSGDASELPPGAPQP